MSTFSMRTVYPGNGYSNRMTFPPTGNNFSSSMSFGNNLNRSIFSSSMGFDNNLNRSNFSSSTSINFGNNFDNNLNQSDFRHRSHLNHRHNHGMNHEMNENPFSSLPKEKQAEVQKQLMINMVQGVAQ